MTTTAAKGKVVNNPFYIVAHRPSQTEAVIVTFNMATDIETIKYVAQAMIDRREPEYLEVVVYHDGSFPWPIKDMPNFNSYQIREGRFLTLADVIPGYDE